MATEQEKPQGSQFWQASPDYHGVLAEAEGVRLIVSPNGSRYALQVPAPDGTFVVRRHRKLLSKLLPDLPDAITAQGLDHLPDNAADYPRAWAKETEALRERVRRASKQAEDYAGVIASGEGVRLAFLPDPARYILQVRDAGQWRQVSCAKSRDPLVAVVWGERPTDGLAVACVGDRTLKGALHMVPPEAADYRGRKPEGLKAAAVPRPALADLGRRQSDRSPNRARRPESDGQRPQGVEGRRKGDAARKGADAAQQAHRRAQGQT